MVYVFILWALTTQCTAHTSLAAKKASKPKVEIKCDVENRKKADACADKLFFVGRNSRKYPETSQQMSKHCKQTNSLIRCAKDYTDTCAKGVQKQLANVMLYTVKTNQKSYCSKSSKREEVISFAACGNAVRDETSTCMDNFLMNLGKANAVEQKYKVPHACCAFHKLKGCIMTAARDKGSPVCVEKKLENYEKYINAMAGNTLNLMCTDYEEDSDKCQKLPPMPTGAKYAKATTIMVGFGNLLLNA
ncbi:unnamed protein product [Medioppia subpectinata]|uniref:Secreted protein n=1 Tax=Medioppia subpectinata TaxID=1979941 RepID=A0A7R9PZ35_9ACAR|nr:unnamed protein product [Medioppia subpectinata]CAG2106572.1 unnamed protein product [Medioppia subpectinata]